jgi:hypothetical protein
MYRTPLTPPGILTGHEDRFEMVPFGFARRGQRPGFRLAADG